MIITSAIIIVCKYDNKCGNKSVIENEHGHNNKCSFKCENESENKVQIYFTSK